MRASRLGVVFSLIALALAPAPAAEAEFTQFQPVAGTLGSIPDGGAGTVPDFGAPLDVQFSVTGVVGPLSNVEVRMSFEPDHTHVGDLDVTLIAPGGAPAFTIFSRTGATFATSSGDNSDVDGTYAFTDTATTNWWTAASAALSTAAIPAGNYRTTAPGGAGQTDPAPATSLAAAFAGVSDPNGTWTLRFRDANDGDTGTVSGATISLTTSGTTVATSLGGDIDQGGGCTTFSYGPPRDMTFGVAGHNGFVVTGVRVAFDITHNEAGALDARLISPGATRSHPIFSPPNTFGCGSDADLAGKYRFSDIAPASPSWLDALSAAHPAGTVPAGAYRTSTASPPQSTLMSPVFAGLPPDGMWTLRFRNQSSTAFGNVSLAELTLDLAPDADGDSTPDASDICPGTPPGSTVNDDGCATADYKPDAMIRRPADASPLGDGTYSTDGTGQTLVTKVRRGKTAVYHVTIENDNATADDSYRITGCTSSRGFKVTYTQGTTEVTGQVISAGGFTTPSLAPDETLELLLRIKVGKRGPKTKLCDMTATSESSPGTSVDVVGGDVKVKR